VDDDLRRGGAPVIDAAALLDRLPEMVLVIAGDLTVKYVNQRLLDAMGYEHDAVIGSNIFDYVHPDDLAYMASTWGKRAAKPGETGILIEARGRNADGTWRAVEILGLSLLDDGLIDGMIMTMRDLVSKVDAGYAAGRIRSMLDRTTDVVLLVDRQGRIGYANRRLTSSLGVDHDDAVGTLFTSLIAGTEHARFDEWFADLVELGDHADPRIRLVVRRDEGDARARTMEWQGTNQIDDPLIAGVILSGRDVTDLVDMEHRIHAQTEQLRHSAGHDALTGLLNRPAFIEQTSRQLTERRAAADEGDVVFLFCDLDRFKQVNDTHGHAAGDHVLRVAADRLRNCLRDDDVVARWGGDEFTVLLHGSPSEAAVSELVVRLRQRLNAPIGDGQRTTAVGVTVGVSRAAVAGADALEMLGAADEAMYARKGRR
jgi:diguanylate cyclase (GGDEF)-like protein/PAS domain S-box-containing protein